MALFNRKTDDAAPTTTAPLTVDPALAALTGDYTIDPVHSTIGFTVRHAMVTTVRGKFTEYEGHRPGHLLRLDRRQDRQRRHRHRRPRRPPGQRRLLRGREVPPDDLPFDEGRAAR